jgi:predicted nucleic acid-binding protein
VLLYVASGDPAKAERAERLSDASGTISVRVLNEITTVARRKMGVSWQETCGLLSMIRGLLVVQPPTIEVLEAGLALAEHYELSIWDAMIAAIAGLAAWGRQVWVASQETTPTIRASLEARSSAEAPHSMPAMV